MAKSFSSLAPNGRQDRINTINTVNANDAANVAAQNDQADSLQDQLARDTDRIRRMFSTRALLRSGTAS